MLLYKQIFTLLFFLLVGNVLSADLSGIVLRKPAETVAKKKVARYNDRTTNLVEDCQCSPGVYSVVYLTSENLPEIKVSDTVYSMSQKNKAFDPSVIAVSVGSTVEFPNLDPFFHNVFSYSKPKKFDLGRYPNGESQSVVFDKPGIIKVFCEIHYSMRAYIHVLETPYLATSDELGKFKIIDIEPGNYTIHVWQENLPNITQEIEIKSGDNTVEIR